MTFYKFLYNRLLPTLFRMQDHTNWFIWIPILGDVVRIKKMAINYLKLQRGNDVGHTFDSALSNFGYLDKTILYNLINAIKVGGTVVISGPQPLKGIRKLFYPVTFVPEMIFGLTWRTLHKFPIYIDILRKELVKVHIDDNTFAKYFVAVSGTKK